MLEQLFTDLYDQKIAVKMKTWASWKYWYVQKQSYNDVMVIHLINFKDEDFNVRMS